MFMEKRIDFKYITDIMPAADAKFAEKFPGRYFSTPKKWEPRLPKPMLTRE